MWRRRRCVRCGAIFTSEERVEYGLSWLVYTHGDFKPFSRDKLLLSLYECCEHRPTALSDAQGLTETVMSKLPTYRVDDTPNTLVHSDIGRLAHIALNRFDKAAAVRYLSLHQRSVY